MSILIPKDVLITGINSSTEISPEIGKESQREVIVVTNTSTGGQIITLAVGHDATSGVGIILYPTGAWAESIDSVFIPTNFRITAASSAAGGQLTVHERVIPKDQLKR